jgi:iron complex outermembrane receptor protein
LSATNQIAGGIPYTVLSPATKRPFDVAFKRPLVGGREQFTQIGTTQVNIEVTQKVTDWLSVVARGQHTDSRFKLAQYAPFALLAPNGLLLLSASGVNQTSDLDVIDSYARATFDTGPLSHKVVAGYTYLDSRVRALNADNGGVFPYNFLTATAPPRALATRFSFGFSSIRKQEGIYGQYLLGFWKVHLLAGLRNNKTDLTSTVARVGTERIKTDITTPNYGAVVDVTPKFSVFGTLAYGFLPTFATGRGGIRLPDVKTRNAETGVKWDLLGDRIILNASWFSIRESNRIRQIAGFATASPGLLGRGIDINLSGEPIRGLSIVAAYTRTNYRFLSFDPRIGGVVNAQPRDVYSLYSSYRHRLSDDVSGGLGGGISGRSGSSVDNLGIYRIDGTFQADLNAFATVGKFDINAGVRNLTGRQNYLPTITPTYVPLGEPRSWRMSVGYRFR